MSPGALAWPPQTNAAIASAPFPPRLGIVHGNRLCGDLLVRVATAVWGCTVAVCEHSTAEGLSAIERERPDVVIVGHHPPLVDGLELLLSLRRQDTAKLVVSARRITEHLVYRLGSMRFHAIMEETGTCLDELQTAVARVRAGSRYLCSRYLHIAARLRDNPSAFPKLLSRRQEEVLICIAHELEDEDIGHRLGMSATTAQRHRTDIMRKLDLHKTPRLIRYAAQAGFDDAALPRGSE